MGKLLKILAFSVLFVALLGDLTHSLSIKRQEEEGEDGQATPNPLPTLPPLSPLETPEPPAIIPPLEVSTLPPLETQTPIAIPPLETVPPLEVSTLPPLEPLETPAPLTVPPLETIPPLEVSTLPPLEPLETPAPLTVPPESLETLPPLEVSTLPPLETIDTLPPLEVSTLPPLEILPPLEVSTLPPLETIETLPPLEVSTLPPLEPLETPVPPESLETLPPLEVSTLPPLETIETLPPLEVSALPPLETLPPLEVSTLPPLEPLETQSPLTVPPLETLPTMAPINIPEASTLFPLVTLPTTITTTEMTPTSPESQNEPPPNPPEEEENAQPFSQCNLSTKALEFTIINPSYPLSESDSKICQYNIIPQKDHCALRFEFDEGNFGRRTARGCTTDSLQILNSGEDTPIPPLCGNLQNFQYTIKMREGTPITVIPTTQNKSIWKIKAKQIKCSSIKTLKNYQTGNCGNSNMPLKRFKISEIDQAEKTIGDLLTCKSHSFLEDNRIHNEADKLLENATDIYPNIMRIVGGSETAKNEFPWQVLITANNMPLCGGSLINNEYILTAAHCVNLNVRTPLAPMLRVNLGEHDIRTTTETRNQIFKVSKIVSNVHFEGLSQDIALLKLASKVRLNKNINTICFPSNNDQKYAGDKAIATGWGKNQNGVASPYLKKATLTVISQDKCRQQWKALGDGGDKLIDDKMLCVEGGNPSPCNGDSGGPLSIINKQTGKWELIGLTSFGSLKGCASPSVPVVFTRVNSFFNWLAFNLADD